MKTISYISAPASILGFLITYFSEGAKPNPFQIICLLAFVFSTILVLVSYYRSIPKIYENPEKVKDYMLDWISNTGRIVIFTRDMSWADNSQLKNKLLEKSRNNELIICMPVANNLSTELKANGATIIEYKNINYVPESRFTIIRYQRNDSRIAIGKTYDAKRHIIEEYSNGQHPLFHVAQDLVNILIKSNEAGKNL